MPVFLPTVPKLIVPSSGFGQFIAALDGDTLHITLPVAFLFVPGNPDVVPGLPTAAYQWTDEARGEFIEEFRQRARDAWSRQFDLERWDGQRRVEVIVRVEEVALEDALWRIFVAHYPLDAIDTEASVCDAGSSHHLGGCFGNSTGQRWGTVRLARTHLLREQTLTQEIATIPILFERNQETAQDPNWIHRAVVWLARDLGWRVRLDGYADFFELETNGTETPERQLQMAHDLSRRRLQHIEDILKANGVDEGLLRGVSHGDPNDDSMRQRVDLTVSRTQRQDTLAHEVGHMLGLGDEAVTGSASIEDPLPSPDYAALVFWYTGTLIRRHDDEGMMSRGSTVRFWHYAPFLETLEILTKSADWKIVPRKGKEPSTQMKSYLSEASPRPECPSKVDS